MSQRGKTKMFGKIVLFLFLMSTFWSLLRIVVLAVISRDWMMLVLLFFILALIVLSTVCSEVEEFARGEEQFDDITLVALRVT